MFSKSGSSFHKESIPLNTVSEEHFFECVREEKEEDLRNYFRDPSYKVWLLKEENDYTALHRAVFNNSEKIVSLIIEELKKRIGFESKMALSNFINEKTNEGITALHYAAYKGNITIAKLLIENGAVVEMVTNRGKNVMHLAAEGNQPSIMYYFIAYQAQDIISIDDYGSTPLHWACYAGAEEAVLFLLSLKANIDAKDKEGITPLNLAVQSKREKIVKLLLQRGADKTIDNNRHETPLDVAVKKNYFEMINLLKDKDYNPLCTLETPIEYVKPDNIYKKFIFFIFIVPEIVLLFGVLPYLDTSEIIVNTVFFVFAFLSYIFLLAKEPGEMKNEELLRDANGENPLKTLIDKNQELKMYCPFCYVRKTGKGKHCFICNKCIEGFDHHCFWINKCIGRKNVCAYFTFLSLSFIYVFTSIYVSVMCINNDVYIPPDRWIWDDIAIARDNMGLKVLCVGFVLIVAVFLSFPLFFLIMIQVLTWLKVIRKKETIEEVDKKNKEKKEIKKEKAKEDLEISLIEQDVEDEEEDAGHLNINRVNDSGAVNSENLITEKESNEFEINTNRGKSNLDNIQEEEKGMEENEEDKVVPVNNEEKEDKKEEDDNIFEPKPQENNNEEVGNENEGQNNEEEKKEEQNEENKEENNEEENKEEQNEEKKEENNEEENKEEPNEEENNEEDNKEEQNEEEQKDEEENPQQEEEGNHDE